MLINDLFEKDVTRDINPVVYFHETDPAKVAEEVSEYIITGGYPAGDPRRNEHGIHEQFVRLLSGMAADIKKGGTDQPAAWISGFYGSGKSSFAKLLGLSLNGLKLPDGTALSDALLKQYDAPNKADLVAAWESLVQGIKPMAVVFDIGSVARDDEHIHSAIVRRCQVAMDYCESSAVADHEMKLEADGLYPAFLDKVKEVHGKPWSELKNKKLAEDYFSAALHALQPELYDEKMSWADAKAGSKMSLSAEEAVRAIFDMMKTRRPGRHLFIVVDEVSQYVHENADRMLKLQSLVAALGERLKGQAWLLATGQQKLEEGASASANLSKMKDRFPAHLRVHLGTNNIRDVVHQRLLKKKHTVRGHLEELFEQHRPDLSLYAYECQHAKMNDLVDIYPMLPGQIDLLMEITTGLRDRSSRVQGDSHAIRGLLQLLGDLFRESNLGAHEVGTLITLDRIYDVLHTALDADIQTTLTRAFDSCKNNPDFTAEEKKLAEKVLKAVSLLELIPDERAKKDADLIARSLYERLGQGSRKDAVQKLLDVLRGSGHIDYSDKSGYKIQSSAGQEWQKERDAYAVGPEKIGGKILDALTYSAMPQVAKLNLDGLAIPWQAWFSNAIGIADAPVKQERAATRIEVDFRYLPSKVTKKDEWVAQSDAGMLKNRVLWVTSENDAAREAASKLVRAERMIERYEGSEASLSAEKRRFLTEERNHQEDAQRELTKAVEAAFLDGSLYFRGKDYEAKEHGSSIATVLADVGDRAAKQLYPNPVTFRVTEGDLKFLVESKDLAAPPPVFGESKLGILVEDAGRFEAACTGAVPSEILAVIKEQPGITGSSLLSLFGGPPHGYTSDIVRACIIGLMCGYKLRVRIAGLGELTSAKDEGARDLFKDNTLRKAEFFPNEKETVNARDRNAICKLFLEQFGEDIARDNDAIADAVGKHFSAKREQLSELQRLLARLPSKPQPKQLDRLEKALEDCRRSRKVEPILEALKRSLTALGDGLTELRRLSTDFTEEVVQDIVRANDFAEIFLTQLEEEVRDGHVEKGDIAEAASTLREGLRSDRPWDARTSMNEAVQQLRAVYVKRRTDLIAAHQTRIEEAVKNLKLREGFDVLSQDDQHTVLQHIREGASFNTKTDSPVPTLRDLETQSPARLVGAIEKALAQLDELRESKGERPTVTVSLNLSGREFDSEKAVERFLAELREQLLADIRAGNRVRLK